MIAQGAAKAFAYAVAVEVRYRPGPSAIPLLLVFSGLSVRRETGNLM